MSLRVSVQLPTYADNVVLPAFVHRSAAIDRYRLPAGTTAANLQHRNEAGEWDQGCICQISLGGVEVLAIEVDDRANA